MGYHFEYALVLKDLNEYENACKELEYCMELNSHPKITHLYGLVLCEMNGLKQGLNYLHRAYKSDLNNAQYKADYQKYEKMNNMKTRVMDTPSSMDETIASFNHLEITTNRISKAKERRKEIAEIKEDVPATQYEFERWMTNKIVGIDDGELNEYLHRFRKKHF